MSNVSSSNGQGVIAPKLRFNGFLEDWELVRIGDVYAERSERGAENMDLLSVTMTEGVKMRSDIEGKDNSSEDKSNYKIVYTGDMVYNSMRMWQGASGISPYDGIVSPAYTILKPRIPISNGFFAALFKNERLINAFRKNSQGMTSDTWNLKYPQIETIKIHIPSVSEQEKISEFIALVDAKIAKQRILVDSLKKYKRGLLDRVFNQNNGLYPSSWTEISIEDLFEPISDKNHPDETVLTIIQGQGTAPRDSIERRIAYDKSSVKTYKLTDVGDFILHLRSFEGGLEKTNQKGIVSPAYTVLRPKLIVETGFYYAYFRSYWFINNKLRDSVEGIRDGKSINMTSFWKIKIPLPSLEEQQRISHIFGLLDEKIQNSASYLVTLQALKRTLLKQMFI